MITLPRRTLRFALAAITMAAAGAIANPTPAHAAGSTFHITGRGWGHGIGLSQEGAYGLSKRVDPVTGDLFTAAGIIRYYFGNTTKTKVEAASGKNVRVLLDPNAGSGSAAYTKTAWSLRAGHEGGKLLVQASNLPSAGVLTPGDGLYTFKPVSGGIAVYSGGTSSTTRWNPSGVSVLTGTVTVTESASATPALVQVAQGTGIYERTYVRYRDAVQVTSNGSNLKLVNRITLEHYLYGVVPREVPASWASGANAALQAQAIAARSYAYVPTGELYTTTRSQAYMGHSSGSDRTATQALEDSRSNKAVDDTRGQIVYYYTTSSSKQVITTYFSSASGGHTANVEDVWTSSDPKPWLKGVPDPDQSSPYHLSWPSTISHDGGALASKIRAYSSSAAEASPRYVTGVSITRASNGSGYAVRVTTTWSNGKTHSMSGNAFQAALGLRSTKFSVGKGSVPKPPSVSGSTPLAPATRYEETDSRLAKTGTWVAHTSPTFSGGSQTWSQTANDRFYVTFSGTGVRWVATKSTGYGKANVYVDGVYKKTIDLYRSSTLTGVRVFMATGLPSGSHTMMIKVLGSKQSAAVGTRVNVDAVEIEGGSLTQATAP
ncbi:MAG: SpoIID/LytB domain-containing protein [Coriobacteriales bacterium]|nr:SpoIID/LytB domain-containing protein [Coriobacteriales bacterium]